MLPTTSTAAGADSRASNFVQMVDSSCVALYTCVALTSHNVGLLGMLHIHLAERRLQIVHAR